MSIDFQSNILIILPKPHEYEAFRRVFPDASITDYNELGMTVRELNVSIPLGNNNNVLVKAVCLQHQGEMARNLISLFIQNYKPNIVILLGTAGGPEYRKKLLPTGTVVFSSDIVLLTEHMFIPERRHNKSYWTKRYEVIKRSKET